MVTFVDLGLALGLVAIALVDMRSQRIPDLLSLPLIAAGLLWSAGAGADPWREHLIGAAVGYASLAALGALYFRWRGFEGLGLGDAKLFAAAGAWLGWRALPSVLLIATLTALAFVLLSGSAARTRRIAFGPWICLGIWVGWLASA